MVTIFKTDSAEGLRKADCLLRQLRSCKMHDGADKQAGKEAAGLFICYRKNLMWFTAWAEQS